MPHRFVQYLVILFKCFFFGCSDHRFLNKERNIEVLKQTDYNICVYKSLQKILLKTNNYNAHIKKPHWQGIKEHQQQIKIIFLRAFDLLLFAARHQISSNLPYSISAFHSVG